MPIGDKKVINGIEYVLDHRTVEQELIKDDTNLGACAFCIAWDNDKDDHATGEFDICCDLGLGCIDDGVGLVWQKVKGD